MNVATGGWKNGEILEVHCTFDPESRGGNTPDGRRVKGTIHWVSERHAGRAPVRLYDRLFTDQNPLAGDTDFRDLLNPDSFKTVECVVEPALLATAPGQRVQFERVGYFCADTADSRDGAPVFNRTVALRDSWARMAAAKG